MRRLRLSTLLIALNVGLLLLALAGVAFVAVRLLRQLADDQALARVGQAGASARNAIGRSGHEALTDAQLLGERPTLRRLLETQDIAALTTFLTQFQQTSQLDGCAVLLNDEVVAHSGLSLEWAALWAAHRQDQDYFLQVQAAGGPPLLGAWADMPTLPGGGVLVVILLDDSISRQISAEIGLPVTIWGAQIPEASSPLGALRRQVLATGESRTTRFDNPARYLTLVPLRAPTGEVAGLIETELSATVVTRSLQQLIQTLLLLTLGVAALAALISSLIGRRLGRPLQDLTRAAAHIGLGNLATPVPALATAGAEIGTLAATLEEMRRRLLQLTANLQRQQAESNAILTGIVEGVFTVDRERRIKYLNPQAAILLGLTPAAVLGRFCGDVLNPQGPGEVRPCEEQCPIVHARFRSGARATEHLRLPNGQRRTVVITSAPPADDGFPSGEPRQIQVMRDETEVEATRRLRDAVLANISHEFRTPLSAQLASIELLLDQLPDLSIEQIGDLVLSLQRGTLRLTQLIDNLLESVRIEAGQPAIRRQRLALDAVIEQALELTRPLLDQRQQEVRVELPYPLPPLSGDAPRLTQVFVNLLANANKFAPPGSIIRIGGAVGEATVTMWVEDQGPGLPMSDQATLFAPFARAGGSLSEEPEAGGVGLGLWIVKSIVERHGGRVDAQSAQSSAAGARLSVTLPREAFGEDSGR